jgi:PAS domain S-box-containing protein
MGQSKGDNQDDVPETKNNVREKTPLEPNHGPAQKWLSLLDVIPTILISIDTNYKILDFSRLMRGRQSLSSIGQSVFDFIAKECHQKVKNAIDESIATGQVRQYRTLGIGPAGPDTAWYQTVVVPELKEGKVASLILVCTDITSELKTEKTLRETMNYLQVMLNATTATFCLADEKGRILIANGAAAKKLNKTPEELVGLTAQEVISGLQPEKVWALRSHYVKEVFDTGRAVQFEDERNGNVFRNCIYPIFDAGGKPYLMVYFAEDITEIKKAERAARESEERFRELADFLPQSIFELDTTGKIVYANKRAFESSGYNEEDLAKGVYAVDMFIEEDREKLIGRQKRLLAGENLDGMEYRGKRKDGSIYPVAVYSSPIKKDGQVVGIRGISIDISERKKIERELMLAEEKYRMIVDNVRSSIAIFDEQGNMQYANKIAGLSLNLEPERMVGKNMWELFPKEVADGQMATIREVIRTGSERVVLKKTKLRGKWRWYHTVVQAFAPDGGKPRRALIIATDITDEKENDIRNAARLKLLDRIRDADNKQDVIMFGCQAVREFNLFNKVAFYFHDEAGQFVLGGKCGYKASETKNISKSLSGAVASLGRKKERNGTAGLYVVSRGVGGAVTPELVINGQNGISREWSASDLGVFCPESSNGESGDFCMVLGDPCDGRNPSIRDVEYLQEIAEIVGKDLRRIDGVMQLKEERQNLNDANVALGRVLEHIEKEKNEIKQKLAAKIEKNIMPALNKLIRSDGSVHRDFYEVLKTELDNVVYNSGSINQLLSRLTPRELEICNFIKTGLSNSEIAGNLFISLGTVKKHREQIRRKLGLANKRVNLATFLRGSQGV